MKKKREFCDNILINQRLDGIVITTEKGCDERKDIYFYQYLFKSN